MLVKLHTSASLLYLPSQVEQVKTIKKPLTLERRIFFDRLVIASIYAAGIVAAVLVS